jgi:2-haloacid dehalogenase
MAIDEMPIRVAEHCYGCTAGQGSSCGGALGHDTAAAPSCGSERSAMTGKLSGIEACVFDAYGTLFDFNTAAAGACDEFGADWQKLSDLWRLKQLQYTWLRGLAGHHAEFWQVTGDALDFALAQLGIVRPGLRERLMQLYLRLGAFPEVPAMLQQLKLRGIKLAILSNGSPAMLAAVVSNSGTGQCFRRRALGRGGRRLQAASFGLCARCATLAMAPNASASSRPTAGTPFRPRPSAFGCSGATASANPPERIPDTPDGEITDLSALPDLV